MTPKRKKKRICVEEDTASARIGERRTRPPVSLSADWLRDALFVDHSGPEGQP